MSDFPYQRDPFVDVNPLLTVQDAQEWLRESSGVLRNRNPSGCPCCNQLVMVNRRAFNLSVARSLIWLVLHFVANPDWIHVPKKAPKWMTKAREYPKLAYWKMAEAKPNLTDPTKRCPGWWRPTQFGIEFAYDRLRVASHAYVYNKAVLDYDDTRRIGIRDALKAPYDYSKLMSGGGDFDVPASDDNQTS